VRRGNFFAPCAKKFEGGNLKWREAASIL